MQRTLAHLPFGTDFQKMIVQLALTLCLGAPLPGHWADPAPARRMLRDIGTVEAGADGITVDGKKVEGGTLVIGGLTIDAPPEPASRVNHAPRSALTPKAEDEFAAGAPLPQQQPKDAPAQKKPWWHFW